LNLTGLIGFEPKKSGLFRRR